MNEYPANILVKVLYQEYPEIARKVVLKVKEHIPDHTFTDYSQITEVVRLISFCIGESVESLKNKDKSRKLSNDRRVLAVTLLKLYQPEILSNLVNTNVNSSLIFGLQDILQVSKKTAYHDMRVGRQHYHLYRDFRENVNDLYTKIIYHYGKETRSC